MLPASMFAMTADPAGGRLLPARKPVPQAGDQDLVVRVLACGVCRTDLHIIDGDLPPRRPGVVPEHEVVGQVVALGAKATRFAIGQRVRIPWLGQTCGCCAFCATERENLCDQPVFTGYDRDGGFAEYAAADERFCFALPERYDDAHAAPLLCAGLIGFRAWRLAGAATAHRLGLSASAPRRTSSARSPRPRGRRCSPSPVPATGPGRISPAAWAPPGPEIQTKPRRQRWTRR